VEKQLFPGLTNQSGPILVTGHTGFKGAWLVQLLSMLEIPAIGFSLPPEKDSLYISAGLQGKIPETYSDIRDADSIKSFINQYKPAGILHMAAQPLVLKSYRDPVETFATNVLGTANVLEAAFATDCVKYVGVVTTDKVYKNDNLGRRFVETDPLFGKDPYSASKVGTESVVSAWQQIAKISGGPKLISLRAGNVIGGGDLAQDRIIPDLVRGRISGTSVQIRNANSTRPWQHALDPLLGYLTTLDQIDEVVKHTNSLNFGPNEESLTVGDLVELLTKDWRKAFDVEFDENLSKNSLEATTLGLDSSLAHKIIGWNPAMKQAESISNTAKWWDKVLNEIQTPLDACGDDIHLFIERTKQRNK